MAAAAALEDRVGELTRPEDVLEELRDLREENERLREALERYIEVTKHEPDGFTDLFRTALGPKETP